MFKSVVQLGQAICEVNVRVFWLVIRCAGVDVVHISMPVNRHVFKGAFRVLVRGRVHAQVNNSKQNTLVAFVIQNQARFYITKHKETIRDERYLFPWRAQVYCCDCNIVDRLSRLIKQTREYT